MSDHRETTARVLTELAEAVMKAARPVDREQAGDLHDYVIRFAAAQKTIRHWPLDGPMTLDPIALESAARLLEGRIHDRAEVALAAYRGGTVSFDLLNQTIRGLLD